MQVAHNYLGMKHENDFLDMRNDFLFTGMAVIRNQAYGMTSCGTGGVWSVIQKSSERCSEIGPWTGARREWTFFKCA